MAKNTTTVNHSDLPCTCTSMDQYVDGLCPGCTEAADRDADLKEHVDAQAAHEPHPFPEAMIEDAFEGDDVSDRDVRFHSGTGESMDDSSYERYLNRG
jgi:hypothetical protein